MKQKSTFLTRWMLLMAIVFMGAGTVSAADKWVLTAPSDLATGDLVVIVDQTTSRAMSNDNGTSGAPAATTVTLNTAKDEITGEVAATLQWEVTTTTENNITSYQFGVAETDNYLYANASNNGLRVGTNNNNSFTVYNNNGVNFLFINTTNNNNQVEDRYIGVYNNQDWRCYTSINNNIKNTVTAFYKKVSDSGPVDPTVTISVSTFAVGETATISGPEGLSMSFESDDEDVATVSTTGVVTGISTGNTTITATWSAVADTYNAGSATFTVTITEPVAATVYEKVTNVNQLVVGNEYILVAANSSVTVAMGAQNNKIRDCANVTIVDDKVSITDEAVTVLTLGGISGAWTFLASDNNKYLALTANSNEIHASDDATLSTSQWIITNDFQLMSTAQDNTRYVRYNSGSPRFACYKSGQVEAYLYVKSGSATETHVDPGYSFSASTAEAILGESFTAPTFSNPNNVAVTFESTDETVATIAQDGTVTILAAGTTTIKATSEANDTYLAGTASYTLTVIDPNAPGTENNPYTVAEARDAIDAGMGVTGVYVKGIVCTGGSNLNNGAMNYWISDDGTETDKFEIYKGKGIEGASFTSVDDVKVGDEVIVYGNIKKYNTTYEFDSGSQLVSLYHPVDTTPSIEVSTNTIEAPAEGVDGTITVTYNNITEVIAEVYLCDAEGEETTYEWIDAEINDENNVYYVIEANDGEARTAYIKVYAFDDDANDVYSELITITQAAYVAPVPAVTYTLATSITSGKHYVIASGTDGDVKVMGIQNNNNRAAVDGTVSGTTLSVASDAGATEVVIYGPDASGNYSIYDAANGYLYAASSGSNHLKSQETNNLNGKWSINFDESIASIVAQGSNTRNEMRYNSSSVIFSCYGSVNNQQDIYLYEKDNDVAEVSTVEVNLNSYGYATYASSGVLDFLDASDNTAFSAWQITGVSGTEITFQQIESTIASGTGILLKGTPSTTITLNVMPGTGVSLVNSNKLEGIVEATYVANDEYYGLSGNSFVKVNAGTVPAGKALLPASEVSATGARLAFVFGGEATGISATLKANGEDSVLYNLSGQRVENPTKGLYIVNGKKVIIK